MLSTHLVVDIAFCAGMLLAFNPVRKIVRKFLSNQAKKTDHGKEKARAMVEKLNVLLSGVSNKSSEVDSHVEEVLNLAEERCRAIFQKGQREMEKMIEDHINLAAEKIEMRIDCFVRSLRLAAVDTATGATQRLLREEADGSSGVEGRETSVAPSDHDDNVVKKLH